MLSISSSIMLHFLHLVIETAQGYEGSAVYVNRFGIESLTSTKRIPIADWFVAVDLPTGEAFAPIRDMQQRMLLATLFLTLLASGLTWWVLSRQLSPLLATASAMAALSDTNQIPPPLAVLTQDEVGQLSIGFNRLIETWTQRESALRESETRFRSLTNMSSDFYWESDAEHRLTVRSASKSEAEGSVFHQTSPIGQRRWEIPYISPDAAGWQKHRAMLDAHLPFRDFELSRIGSDGAERHISISGDPVFDVSGGFKGYRGVGSEITERKQAEEALIRSERLFRSYFNQPIIGIAITSPEKGWLEVNQRLCEMLGYAREEIVRLTWAAITHPDDIASDVAQFERVLRGEIDGYSLDKRFMRKDGTTIHVAMSVACVRGKVGPVDYFVALIEDITERVQTKAALQVSENRYRTLVEWSPDPLVVHRGLQIVYANPAATKLFGANSVQDLVGKSVLDLVHADYHQSWLERLKNVSEHGIDAPMMERRLLRLDGTEIEAEVQGTSIVYDGELAIHIAIRDITERKAGEAARATLETQLRESQKMEALGTLAGGVAHDFNNALAAILGNVELARQDVGDGHAALVSLEEIGKASRRAKDLVQQILAFGRRQNLELRVTSLALVVVETARFIRATLPAGVSLNVDCSSDTPAVLADSTQVTQILLNLCGNALHAVQGLGRPGVIEIRLTCHTEDGAPYKESERRSWSERASLPEGRYACLSVSDNGAGMDRATRERMFEPFFTTKPRGTGTGLGLSVVHGIAQAHKANVVVESALGEGSTFRIYFAAVDAPVPETVVPTAAFTPVDGMGRHVLYVDDEEAIIFLMTRLLERQGFRVSGFTDPREALAAVRANPGGFDLAVTDFNMPGMSGLEVASALREIRPDLPVVLASGYITEDLRQRAPAAGVRELIYKPNTVDDLCEAVARYANAQTASGAYLPS